MKHQSLKIDDRTRTAITPDGRRIPVVDGKFTFLVTPNEDDIKNGIPLDHENCMYCRACRRLYQSTLVWVTRSLAYVELKTKGGKSELQRYILQSPAQLNVKDFDSGKDVTPEAVIFAAPHGVRTLHAQAKAYQRYSQARAAARTAKATSKKKAYVKGELARKVPQTLRSRASGLFQFKIKPPV